MTHYSHAESVFENEIDALQRVLLSLKPNFDTAVNLILNGSGKVIVTGVGKSGIIAHKIAATFASTGTPSVFLNAAEGLHGDLGVICKQDVVIVLSNSAETAELYRLIPSIKDIGARIIGLFGNTKTKMCNLCDCVLDVSIEAEACPLRLAPMTSTTVALVAGDAMAASLMKARNFTRDEFSIFHPGGSLGRRLFLKVSEVMISGDHLPKISPESSIMDAVVEMDRCNIGIVVAITPDKFVDGLFSEGDLRRLVLKNVAMSTTLHHVMTKSPILVNENSSLGEAIGLMEKMGRKVYVLPVVDNENRLVGALRMHDIIGT
jgi:arabinose-5-phosphate isomerase